MNALMRMYAGGFLCHWCFDRRISALVVCRLRHADDLIILLTQLILIDHNYDNDKAVVITIEQ